ncbi:MAG TPA: enoyl-CoA hydratase-related protein [Gemmatimonadales bacterium]|nr:enoyl-CoA hydratase-related protein [Gemmatimonadales bacterium]
MTSMVSTSHLSTVRVELDDAVATVWLSRPASLNAITRDMHHELQEVFRILDDDDSVGAIVLTGEGRAFSAGGDFELLRALHDDASMRPPILAEAWRLVDALIGTGKPTVAAINGAATGLGLTIALLCDIVYAAERARLGDTHIKAGIVPGDGGCLIWPLLVGINRAKEYLLTGELMDAPTAERLGLVNRVFPDGELLGSAQALASRLAHGPRIALRWTKLSLNQWLRQAHVTGFGMSLALEQLSFTTHDQLEALQALREKRSPVFRGE